MAGLEGRWRRWRPEDRLETHTGEEEPTGLVIVGKRGGACGDGAASRLALQS